MAESVKPRGNQLCSGTFGKLWIDGSLAYEVYKFEAKEKTNRECKFCRRYNERFKAYGR